MAAAWGGGQILGGNLGADDLPAPIRQNPLGQGGDTAQTGTADIDDVFQFFRSGQMPPGGIPGLVEGHILACGEGGTLHHGNFIHAAGQPFGDEGGIVLDGLGEGQCFQPDTGENVAGLEDQQGMETHGFQNAAVQQSQIQTGTHFLLQYRVAQPHPLACGFEAGGRNGVDDVLLLQGAVDGGGLGQHPVGILGLVGIQGRIPGPTAQQLRGLGGQRHQGRVVGGDKGGKQFRVVAVAVPLIKGQGRQLLGMGAENLSVLFQGYMEQSGSFFRQSGEHGTVHGQFRCGGPADGTGADAVKVERGGQAEGRLRANIQIHMLKGFRSIVENADRADHTDAAGLEGVVDGLQSVHFQPDGACIVFLGHRYTSHFHFILSL